MAVISSWMALTVSSSALNARVVSSSTDVSRVCRVVNSSRSSLRWRCFSSRLSRIAWSWASRASYLAHERSIASSERFSTSAQTASCFVLVSATRFSTSAHDLSTASPILAFRASCSALCSISFRLVCSSWPRITVCDRSMATTVSSVFAVVAVICWDRAWIPVVSAEESAIFAEPWKFFFPDIRCAWGCVDPSPSRSIS